MQKLNLNWVSDEIGDEYKEWKNGDVIWIESQTGTGKTEFIKTKLLDYAIQNDKKILYICNRINLKRSMKINCAEKQNIDISNLDIETIDGLEDIGKITITSYQKIQYYLLNEKYDLNYTDTYTNYFNYDYVVMDECHYIIQDASFGNETVFFYQDYLKQHNEDSITILISATMDRIKEPLESIYNNRKKPIVYSTGKDYSYLQTYYFKHENDLINTINNDTSGNKWLIFICNITKAKEFMNRIDDSKIVCSETGDYSKENDSEELNNILTTGCFSCKCLIATKALDNGINITDPLLTNIVILAWDQIDFIQMLGRKRIDIKNPQKVNLYIMARYKKSFSSLINLKYDKLSKIIDLWYEDRNLFNRTYDTKINKLGEYSNLFYKNEDGWKLNETGYIIFTKQKQFCEYMIAQFDKVGKTAFIREQLKWINQKYKKSNWIEEVADKKKIDSLETYLDDLIGKKLFKENQVNLIEKIGLKDARGRIQKSFKLFNAYFEENDLDFIIKSERKSKRVNGKVKKEAYWIIYKLTSECRQKRGVN